MTPQQPLVFQVPQTISRLALIFYFISTSLCSVSCFSSSTVSRSCSRVLKGIKDQTSRVVTCIHCVCFSRSSLGRMKWFKPQEGRLTKTKWIQVKKQWAGFLGSSELIPEKYFNIYIMRPVRRRGTSRTDWWRSSAEKVQIKCKLDSVLEFACNSLSLSLSLHHGIWICIQLFLLVIFPENVPWLGLA